MLTEKEKINQKIKLKSFNGYDADLDIVEAALKDMERMLSPEEIKTIDKNIHKRKIYIHSVIPEVSSGWFNAFYPYLLFIQEILLSCSGGISSENADILRAAIAKYVNSYSSDIAFANDTEYVRSHFIEINEADISEIPRLCLDEVSSCLEAFWSKNEKSLAEHIHLFSMVFVITLNPKRIRTHNE